MMELLVTIMVMSFGFLSLASFQMGTLKHLAGSNQHYLATSLATSMGESMHANADDAGAYVTTSLAGFSKSCATSTDCTTAENDLYRWKNAFKKHAIQDLDASISINGLDATISITWKEKVTSGFINSDDSELQTYNLQVPL